MVEMAMSKLKSLYAEIWAERPHRCQVCGYPLRRPIAHVFSHIKGRGAHPSLKYDKRNIQLWCSTVIRRDGEVGCHESWHHKPEVFKRRAREHGWQEPEIEK